MSWVEFQRMNYEIVWQKFVEVLCCWFETNLYDCNASFWFTAQKKKKGSFLSQKSLSKIHSNNIQGCLIHTK